jgi:hypothetical protein
MALTNNLVVAKKDFPALAEALKELQSGDKLRLRDVEVTLVENLPDRASFDVTEAEPEAVAEPSEPVGPASELADAVLGVMAKPKKK